MSGPAAEERRPISRRIMVALFLLMMVPTAGWLFFADVASRSTDPGLAALQREIRLKLALTLGASLAALAAVVVWVRRSILDRLEALAGRAREARGGPWSAAPAAGPEDEITDLSRALDDAFARLSRRAEEASRFAANLSHELRTPLAGIRGAAEILGDPSLSPEERRRFAEHVVAESERLERLVTGMIEIARSEGARTGSADLAALLPEVARRVQPLLERVAQSLTVEVEPGPPVAASPDLVSRVVLALLENAMKYAPAGDRLVLAARHDGDGALLSLDDSGPGVPEALRERVFDRCFTTDRDADGAGPRGAGLGLAIARGLAESAGGRIWVEASPLGGASFRVRLPLRRDPVV